MSTLSLTAPFCRAFRVAKGGHRKEECEDACALDPARGRYAVADGAAESSHSGLWAELLTQEFVRQREEPGRWASWLPELQQRWLACVTPAAGSAPLPWYAEVRLEEGAFATFLGFSLEAPGEWRAWAVGDSCLFQVRGGQLLRKLPLTSAAEFSSTPWLVGSRTPADDVPVRRAGAFSGDWRAGDTFWLMTDALAQWFLRESETKGGAPWKALDRLACRPEEEFVAWVEQQRGAGVLRNDDVTLVGVCL